MKCDLNCLLAILALSCVAVSAREGFGPGQQDWGYVDVRKGAHMFYWLYYTTAYVNNYTERPLAIWLQGGPGASSAGYGNFEELGPLDLDGNYRNHTWVKDMNVLFIDSPVGSGYSYVDNPLQLVRTNKKIALDLVNFMKGFYKAHPEFETVPLHILTESYGGKMAPEFALELYYAIKRGELRSNLTSVALGDPWTSPSDSQLSWGPLLWNIGIVDDAGHKRITAAARRTEKLVNANLWLPALAQLGIVMQVLQAESRGVDWYNIQKTTNGEAYTNVAPRDLNTSVLAPFFRNPLPQVDKERAQRLQDLMNGPIKKALDIPYHVKWLVQDNSVMVALFADFMKPAVNIVTELLDKTDVHVAVYSGHLDLICATAGTVNWVNNMEWKYKSAYVAAPRIGINVDGILEGYEKSAGNFTMFWINRAGHMVPADNPAGMSHILKKLVKFG